MDGDEYPGYVMTFSLSNSKFALLLARDATHIYEITLVYGKDKLSDEKALEYVSNATIE